MRMNRRWQTSAVLQKEHHILTCSIPWLVDGVEDLRANSRLVLRREVKSYVCAVNCKVGTEFYSSRLLEDTRGRKVSGML